jgi:hypothetical protein
LPVYLHELGSPRPFDCADEGATAVSLARVTTGRMTAGADEGLVQGVAVSRLGDPQLFLAGLKSIYNQRFSAMFGNFRRFLAMYFRRFSPIFTDFRRFSPIFADFRRFSPILCHKFKIQKVIFL